MRWLILALLCAQAFAVNAVYIGQASAGSGDGSSCANQKAYTYFNTAGNWSATPTGVQIGPDTTVHLCGTITGTGVVQSTTLVFQASGTSGHVITLFWEAAATISLPVCGTKDSGGCIDTNGKTFLTLDGNSTSNSIQATADGTGKANQLTGVGIRATNCSNCEFKNLDIENIYLKSGTDDAPAAFSSDPTGIWVSGSNILIHDSTFNQMNHGITDPYNNADTNIQVYNCTFNNINQGVSIGNNNANTISNVIMRNNHVQSMANWDNPGNQYHHDGLFWFQDGAGTSAFTNVYVYDNLFDGDIGANCTAWVFYNSGLDGIYVFNNKFFNPGGRACAMVEGGFAGDRNYFLYNNYFDCGTAGRALQYSGVLNFTIENNAYNHCNEFFEGFASITGTVTIDYNVYGITNNAASAFHYNGSSLSFAGFRAAHPTFDANSNGSETDTGASATGVPLVGSSMIHNGTNQFLNLTASCSGTLAALCSDYIGVARPNTSFGWDAGAYQGASLPQAAAPTFSPVASPPAYNGTQTVTLSTASAGCSGSIQWNTTGLGGGTVGTTVTVSVSETVFAQVVGCAGFTDSSVSSAAYTINPVTSVSGTVSGAVTFKGSVIKQ